MNIIETQDKPFNLKRIAVVILNWNGRKFLEDFLPGVIEYSSDVADIYIADNKSEDDSVQYLKTNFPNINIIEFDENFGFAKGYNMALQTIDAEYYIILNSDVQVTENWIKPVIDFMDNNKEYVACQPKLLSFFQPNAFEYAGAAGGFIDKLGYPFCKGRIFNSIEEDTGQYNDTDEIFWATGACMFVRAKEFHDVNGFDDDFFAHMEEIDLCWRLKNLGYKIGYCPNSYVLHVGGGSLPKSSAFKTYLNMRNNLIMVYKNHSSKHINRILIQRFFFDWASSLKFLVDSGFKEFWTVPRAHYYFFRNFKKIKAKRKSLVHKNVSRMYVRSIVFRYFFRRQRYFSELNSNDFTASS